LDGRIIAVVEDRTRSTAGPVPRKSTLVTELGYTSIEGVEVGPLGEDSQALATEAEFKGMDAPYVCEATLWASAKAPLAGRVLGLILALGVTRTATGEPQ
jgi:hypothetical protein